MKTNTQNTNKNYQERNMYLDIDLGCLLYIFRRSNIDQLKHHLQEIQALMIASDNMLTDIQADYLLQYYKYCKMLIEMRE